MPEDIIILDMCTKNDNFDVWLLNMECHGQYFFVILGFFALLPSSQLRKSKFEKTEKIPANMIILHMYTINDNHMMLWFLRYGAQWTEVFVILDHQSPF